MSRSAISLAAALLAVTLVVPVVSGQDDPERPGPATLEGSSLTWCGDVEPIRADAALYGDSPVYVGNPPTARVARWARKQPGYVDVWIDRENLGWITLAFTQDLEKRQAQLRRRFPDIGVVAVEVPNSRKDLRRLQRRVGREVLENLERGASWIDTAANVVGLEVGVLTDEVVDSLEAGFAGEPLCVDGADASMLVPDGPQPDEGDGWTLVGHRQADDAPVYRTGIATDQEQLDALWLEARMPGDAPAADFLDHVVLWFAQAHGSSCANLRLDDVAVDPERSLIYPRIVMPDDPVACTADIAGSYQFFVALERDRLPAAPFRVQLGADDPPPGAPLERTVVEVDLNEPGSVLRDGDAHPDDAVRTPAPLRSGSIIEPGYPGRYAFDVRCGIGYLGQLNGVHWVTDRTELPKEWVPLVDDDGFLAVTIDLRGGTEAHAIATAGGTSVRYGPAREAPAACGA